MGNGARSRTGGFILLVVIAVVLAVAFRWRDVSYPPDYCCDAVGYGNDALVLRQDGLSDSFSPTGLRTYGYPLFVSLALSGVPLTKANLFGYFAHGLAVAQTMLFVVACGALFWALYPVGRAIAWSSAAGLLANPFVVQYLPLRLTEGLTISLAVFLAAIAVVLATRPMQLRGRALLLFLGSLIAGFAMEVRPANVTLVAAWLAFAAVYLLAAEQRRILIAPLVAIGLALPMIPQIAHNVASHGKFTPLPAANLGDTQLEYGVRMLKYHTNAAEKKGFAYLNPFPVDLLWGRAATHALHVFHSVNHDYFFTYIFDLSQWPSVPANGLNHAVLVLGALGGWTALSRRYRAKPPSIVPLDAAWTFVATAVAATLALNSVVAVETRFGLLIYAAAGPLAVWSVIDARSPIRRLAIAGTYGLAVALASAYLLTAE